MPDLGTYNPIINPNDTNGRKSGHFIVMDFICPKEYFDVVFIAVGALKHQCVFAVLYEAWTAAALIFSKLFHFVEQAFEYIHGGLNRFFGGHVNSGTLEQVYGIFGTAFA